VATDILGVSGRAIIHALIEGEQEATKLAAMAQGKLRGKTPELQRALNGRLTEHHGFMLRLLWDELKALEELMARLDQQITEVTRPIRLKLSAWTPYQA